MSSTIISLGSTPVPEDHISQADAWAVARCAELRVQGVKAWLWQPPRREPLCVVYKAVQIQKAAQEAVA